ncbi:MAG: hypothetical protein ACYCVE_04170 [Gemmatimonadaceae bacterium]
MLEAEKVVFLHTPKAGGTALAHYFNERSRAIRRNYFLSFAGVDDSRFIRDDLSTQREFGNRCLIERAFEDRAAMRELKASLHFQQAKLLFGHATVALGDLFPGYRFRYFTVLREPIERTVSNITQFSAVCDGGVVKFGD